MPKTITKTVYTFRELIDLGDTQAIERAREWLHDVATSYNWWDYIYELWTDALAQIGFTDAEIAFSGFWSQGDGASFTASVDLGKLIDFLANPAEASTTIAGEPEDFRPYIVAKCEGVPGNPKFAKLAGLIDNFWLEAAVRRTSHHYVHQFTCAFEAELRDLGRTPRVRLLFEDFADAAEQLRIDVCRAIYRDLEAEYEYLTGDEALLDYADANDYTFDKYGKREG